MSKLALNTLIRFAKILDQSLMHFYGLDVFSMRLALQLNFTHSSNSKWMIGRGINSSRHQYSYCSNNLKILTIRCFDRMHFCSIWTSGSTNCYPPHPISSFSCHRRNHWFLRSILQHTIRSIGGWLLHPKTSWESKEHMISQTLPLFHLVLLFFSSLTSSFYPRPLKKIIIGSFDGPSLIWGPTTCTIYSCACSNTPSEQLVSTTGTSDGPDFLLRAWAPTILMGSSLWLMNESVTPFFCFFASLFCFDLCCILRT